MSTGRPSAVTSVKVPSPLLWIQRAVAGIPAEAADVQVHETVVVVVARNDREAVDRLVQTGLDRDVGEGAVAVVPVEAGAAVRGSDGDVEQAVVVVVEDGRASSAAGLVQSDPGGDVFVVQGRWVPCRPAVPCGIAPAPSSGYPPSLCAASQTQISRAFVAGIGDHGGDSVLDRRQELARAVMRHAGVVHRISPDGGIPRGDAATPRPLPRTGRT